MCRFGSGRSVGGMKTLISILIAVAVLAVAAPAGAMPIDNYRSIPSDTPPTTAPAPASPSSGAETWVVIAVAALAFGAGAGAARLAPTLRLRSAS
jgi:hypothetical protein